MLPKASECILVGFDDGSHSVQYYNKDTHKILSSRNYKYVNTDNTLPHEDFLPEGPDVPLKTPGDNTDTEIKLDPNKRKASDEIDTNPKWTRGAKIDYKWLDNPFNDSDHEDDSLLIIQLMINDESYNAATTDSQISLKDAKQSPDWTEWEKV